MPDRISGDIKSAAPELSESINYLKEAFTHQFNWIALAGAAAFALVSLNGLPLVLAAGLELIYLSVVPNSSRFKRFVRSRMYEEEKKQRELKLTDILQALPSSQRERFNDLQALCENIRSNYRQLSSTSQMFIAQMEDRLNGLLQAYVRLLSAAQMHRDLLKNIDASQIARELKQLQADLENQPAKVQDINRKRIEILNKRVEKFGKLQENAKVIDAQCAAIEDVLQLIRDQSVTLRDPQQVSEQLGGLVHEVEQTEQTVQEVEAIFELAQPDLAGQDLSLTSSSDMFNNRNRIRS